MFFLVSFSRFTRFHHFEEEYRRRRLLFVDSNSLRELWSFSFCFLMHFKCKFRMFFPDDKLSLIKSSFFEVSPLI